MYIEQHCGIAGKASLGAVRRLANIVNVAHVLGNLLHHLQDNTYMDQAPSVQHLPSAPRSNPQALCRSCTRMSSKVSEYQAGKETWSARMCHMQPRRADKRSSTRCPRRWHIAGRQHRHCLSVRGFLWGNCPSLRN